MEVQERPFLDTRALGGVAHPSRGELLAMHEGSYVLRASGGKLTRVPVEKFKLPHDPKFHPQGGDVYMVSDDLVYVKQAALLCKSTDGGRTWTARSIDETDSHWHVLSDGTFISISMASVEAKDPAEVFHSHDEGQTWQKITEIPIEVPGGYAIRYSHWGISRLPDNTVFFGIDLRDESYGGDRYMTGSAVQTFYRSTNGGRTWQGPIKGSESAAEGGIAMLPSGRLLASIRFQRPLMPTESAYMRKVAGTDQGFKHHFLMNSDDGGLTWGNLRPLTTVLGQCYGYPAAQSDGTVVVVHDSRYPREIDAARAMVSHDEGETWQDEVYYMYFGEGGTSYSRSVVLSDDTILTVGGTSTSVETRGSWHAAIGNSYLTAIRWKPLKD
jgi:photosystem II stability/assembly factor-like uncharacterized protein